MKIELKDNKDWIELKAKLQFVEKKILRIMDINGWMSQKDLEEQVKDLLEGKKIFVEGIKSKKGGTYNAYLIPDGVREYPYTKKDGSQATGYEYNFKMEFPKKEEK